MAGAATSLAARFREVYPRSAATRLVRAPGRVNLIGEHTDYNLGFVLPIAIGLECRAASEPSNDGWLRAYSEELSQGVQIRVQDLCTAQPRGDWSDYVVGVARELVKRGYPVAGSNVFLRSSVPHGAGLSSSAAMEVATAMALAAVGERAELVQIGHQAETDFVGVPSGVMDQFASVFCEAGSAMLLDCRSLERTSVRLPDGISLVAVDSRVKHALGASAYRTRVAECAEAVRAIRVLDRNVMSLRDADESHLNAAMGDAVRRRATHVITENARVLAFVAASERGDAAEMGRLMLASHASLRDDYEVSCEELDWLVDSAVRIDGVYGARMTGGGFGGCIVVLLKPGSENLLETVLRQGYPSRFGVEPRIYPCAPSPGASYLV